MSDVRVLIEGKQMGDIRLSNKGNVKEWSWGISEDKIKEWY